MPDLPHDELSRLERSDMLAIADRSYAADVDLAFVELLGGLDIPDLDRLDDRKRRALIPFLQIVSQESLNKRGVTCSTARAVAEGMAIFGFQAGWEAARKSDVELVKPD